MANAVVRDSLAGKSWVVIAWRRSKGLRFAVRAWAWEEARMSVCATRQFLEDAGGVDGVGSEVLLCSDGRGSCEKRVGMHRGGCVWLAG